jgi:Helix-turn-helix domain
MDDLFTLAQAAAILGLSPITLRVDVRRGNLDARRLGSIWVITGEELDRQLIRRGKPPRSAK